jgi:hypothetical protein
MFSLHASTDVADLFDTGRSVLTLRWAVAAVLIALLAYGVTRRRAQDLRRRYWPQVRGRVIGDSGYTSRGGSAFDSVVTFRTLDGRAISGVPRGGVYLGMPVAGREVPVWYDPRDPNLFEARIYALDRAGSLWFVAAVLAAGVLALSCL